MRTFQTGESYPKKFKIIAYLIKLIEGGHSHTFVTWKDEGGRRWISEARGGGGRVISNAEFKRDNLIVNVYDYETTEDRYEDVINYLWETSHSSYGKMQMIGLGIMRLMNFLFGKWKRFTNWFRNGEFSQICCERVIRAVMITGVSMPENPDNMALKETRKFNQKWGKMASNERIKRINGIK